MGGATGGTQGNSPPTPHKGHFYKSSRTDEKNWGMGAWRHQPYLNFSLSLSQVVYKDRI